MKTAVPGEIVDACGGFEKDHRCALRWVLPMSHLPGDGCDLSVVETADQPSFETLGEEFVESIHGWLIFAFCPAIIR